MGSKFPTPAPEGVERPAAPPPPPPPRKDHRPPASNTLLWELVHRVQEAIGKDGCAKSLPSNEQLREIRRLADECDPEGGRY